MLRVIKYYSIHGISELPARINVHLKQADHESPAVRRMALASLLTVLQKSRIEFESRIFQPSFKV